jgi:hypothetical protein
MESGHRTARIDGIDSDTAEAFFDFRHDMGMPEVRCAGRGPALSVASNILFHIGS